MTRIWTSTRPAAGAGILVLAAAAVVACDGSGGLFGSADDDTASSGVVTRFGSVVVNGVEWDTSGASIRIDDAPGTESALRVGQVVTVRGEVDADGTQGEAGSVEFEHVLRGPVAQIERSLGRFTVLEQPVVTGPDTLFDASIPERVDASRRTLADLAEGDIVEVSGALGAQGVWRATRIARGAAGEHSVRGVVAALGTTTFRIGSLEVDYQGAVLDLGDDTLGNGDLVQAQGLFDGSVLTATRVEREQELPRAEGEQAMIEGLVTRFGSVRDFDVGGVSVVTNSGTAYRQGSAADLAPDVKVAVTGEVNASGAIEARLIEFPVQPQDTQVVIAGFVGAVEPAAGTLAIAGFLVFVTVSPMTQFEDLSGAGDRTFSLADLNVGDYVEIRGAEDPTPAANDVRATRVERRDIAGDVFLRGPVQAVDEPDLAILGVLVETDAALFRNADGNPITEAQFFGTVAAGDIVRARAPDPFVVGAIMSAGEVAIEELR